MTSCCTVASISWMRLTSKAAFFLIAATASFGMSPASACASATAISTSSQRRYFASSSQIDAICGRE
jgi:hypothetical protein